MAQTLDQQAHTPTGRKNLLFGPFLPPLLGWLAHGQSIRKGSQDRTKDGGTITVLGGVHSPVSPDPSQPAFHDPTSALTDTVAAKL